jgi:hypothetical protein
MSTGVRVKMQPAPQRLRTNPRSERQQLLLGGGALQRHHVLCGWHRALSVRPARAHSPDGISCAIAGAAERRGRRAAGSVRPRGAATAAVEERQHPAAPPLRIGRLPVCLLRRVCLSADACTARFTLGAGARSRLRSARLSEHVSFLRSDRADIVRRGLSTLVASGPLLPQLPLSKLGRPRRSLLWLVLNRLMDTSQSVGCLLLDKASRSCRGRAQLVASRRPDVAVAVAARRRLFRPGLMVGLALFKAGTPWTQKEGYVCPSVSS